MSKLSTEERDNLPSSSFALPSKRKFPIHDATHVKLAWDMVDRAEGLTEAEREEARRNILKRAKELGIDTSGWDKKGLKASAELILYASTSTISLQDLEHPNRMPFSGILTYFDVPSDRAPGGANGMKVVIPREVGEVALASLKGMAVNFVEGSWDGHNPQLKIGVITNAYTGDPQADGAVPVYVEGYIYAHDFAEAASSIKANQAHLGFSYETAKTRLEPGKFNGEDVLIVRELGYFTGASILLKDSAAYTNTSIAASSDENKGGIQLDEKQLKELLAAALGELETKLKEHVDQKLEALKAEAKEEEKGEKPEEKTEEQNVETKEEGAEGADKGDEEKPAEGELNASADLLAEIKKLIKDELKELKAGAEEKTPQRKSVAYPTTLMAKYDVKEEDDYQKLMASIDARNDLSIEERLALKFEAREKMNKK